MLKFLQVIYILITCLPQIVSIAQKAIDMIEGDTQRNKIKRLNSAFEKARKEKDTTELEDLLSIKRSKPIKINAQIKLKSHGLLGAKKIIGYDFTKSQKKKYDFSLIKKKKFDFSFSGLKNYYFRARKNLVSIDLTKIRNLSIGEVFVTQNIKVVMLPEFILSDSRDQRLNGTIHYDDSDTVAATHVPFSSQMGSAGRMKSGIIPS